PYDSHSSFPTRRSSDLSMLVMVLVGILIGAWQGFWIAYVRIPPFIVTLAGMLVFRGLSNVVLDGMTLAPMPDDFLGLFNNYVPRSEEHTSELQPRFDVV